MSQKTIVIIGASSGIGLELSRELSTQGHQIIAVSRKAGESGLPPNTQTIDWDATGETELEGLPEQIDGLVYCPGSINLKPFHRIKDEEYLHDYQLNALGAVRALRAAIKGLKKAEQASVVLFSTVAVGQGMPFHASVAAAKGAVEGLTRALAAELGPGIRVNCLAPSIVDTPLASGLLSTDEKRSNSAGRHPLKRIGMPEDLAKAAAFLLSEDSGWMTGQVLGIDGGMSSIRPL